MRVLIDLEGGIGGQIVVRKGEICRIGRSAPAERIYPEDSFLSGQHFAVDCSGSECRVRDLASRNGTFLNGSRIEEAILRDGDRLSAGQSHFRVRVENATAGSSLAPLTPADLKPQPKRVLEILKQQHQPLFALLDAARDDRILELLRSSGEKYQSLYEGQQGRELDNWAPYLVELPRESQLLLYLLHEGWGKSWGVYLTCGEPFKEIRKHFRRFLLVRSPEGKELYFRFYDPRVLGTFLVSFNAEEDQQFFGPVGSFLMEGEQPSALLQFVSAAEGAKPTLLQVE